MLPTYKIQGECIIVKMLEPVIIDNILYKQGGNYKLPPWIAKELSKIGYCVFIIKPEEFGK